MVRQWIALYILVVTFASAFGITGKKLHPNSKNCNTQCEVWCDQSVVPPPSPSSSSSSTTSTTTTTTTTTTQTPETTTESTTDYDYYDYDDYDGSKRHKLHHHNKKLKRLRINKRLHKKLVREFKEKHQHRSRKSFIYKDFPSNCQVLCSQSTNYGGPSAGSYPPQNSGYNPPINDGSYPFYDYINNGDDNGPYVPGEDNPVVFTAEPPTYNQYLPPNLFNWDSWNPQYYDEPLLIIGKNKKRKRHHHHKRHHKTNKL